MRYRMPCPWTLVLGFTMLALFHARETRAQEDSPAQRLLQQATEEVVRPFNFPTPTLGGTQFWTDQFVHRDWHIQKNVFTKHCRLVDGYGIRHASGSFDDCLAAFDRVRQEKSIPPIRGKLVVLVHGLGGSRMLMGPMTRRLEPHGYTCCSFEYASTRGTIDDHAKALREVLSHYNDATEINFVAHSMGNIVVRRLMAIEMETRPNKQIDPRIRRFVMIAPPNNGSIVAEDWAKQGGAGEKIAGRAAEELGEGWPELAATLVSPPCEFAIIAGGKGDDEGFNPALPGDDDGLVTVASTMLPNADDFRRVQAIHFVMQADPRVMDLTLRFLQHGTFDEAAEKPVANRTGPVILTPVRTLTIPRL